MDNITLPFIKHLITISLPYVMKRTGITPFQILSTSILFSVYFNVLRKTMMDSLLAKERHHISKCFIPQTDERLGLERLGPQVSKHSF